MKALVFIPALGILALLAADSPKRKPVKPVIIERYDVEKLKPGEVACGMNHTASRVVAGGGAVKPCSCMDARRAKAAEEEARCDRVADFKERMKCAASISVCQMPVTDWDHPGRDINSGELMPAQCKRFCTKARCECCRT